MIARQKFLPQLGRARRFRVAHSLPAARTRLAIVNFSCERHLQQPASERIKKSADIHSFLFAQPDEGEQT